MFIDSHAHIYESDKNVVSRAREALVDFIICPGTNCDTNARAIELAKAYPEVYACVGYHPEDVFELSEELKNKLIVHAREDKVVAIGEIGLDYHFEGADREFQKKLFNWQIDLADKLNLPLVIHARDAMIDTLNILENNKHKLHGGVMHCFSGTITDAERVIALGLDFTIGGVVTFKNGKNVQDVVDFLPLDKILLETDTPYLAPVPYRGKVNEPKYIAKVAEAIAIIKGVSVEEVGRMTSQNAKRVFRI